MSTDVTTATIAEFDDDRFAPLADDRTSEFLEALKRVGSVNGAANAIGVSKFVCYRRRYCDRDFRLAFDAARTAAQSRRLHDASDELFSSLEEIGRLTSGWGNWERGVDELLNVAFDVTEEAPLHEHVNPERLQAARARLHAAGLVWARCVVSITEIAESKAADARRIGGTR